MNTNTTTLAVTDLASLRARLTAGPFLTAEEATARRHAEGRFTRAERDAMAATETVEISGCIDRQASRANVHRDCMVECVHNDPTCPWM